MLKSGDIVWIESLQKEGLFTGFALDINDGQEKCVVYFGDEETVLFDQEELVYVTSLAERFAALAEKLSHVA